MEYLLLLDDSVKPINDNLGHGEVVSLLNQNPSAVAYYWWSKEFGWSCFKIVGYEPNITHQLDDVPNVIKLAAMLE